MRDWAKIGVNVSRYRLLLSEFFFSSFIISRENIIGILMKRKKRCSNRISFEIVKMVEYESRCLSKMTIKGDTCKHDGRENI